MRHWWTNSLSEVVGGTAQEACNATHSEGEVRVQTLDVMTKNRAGSLRAGMVTYPTDGTSAQMPASLSIVTDGGYGIGHHVRFPRYQFPCLSCHYIVLWTAT
jgi:hypothetical protein